jgi:hypothetical protein
MSNTNNRQDRIKLLRQQEYWKRNIAPAINAFSELMEQDLQVDSFLSVEETNALNTKLDSSFYHACYTLYFPESELSQLATILNSLYQYLNNDNYFTTYRYRDTFYLKLNTGFVISRFSSIIDWDGDTLYVHNLALTDSLWIDRNESSWRVQGRIQRTQVYELRVFGQKWISMIHSTYRELLENSPLTSI